MAQMANSEQEAIAKLGKMIKGIRIAMMTTALEDGELHSRPMATQQADFDGDLWFLSDADSAKTYEIGRQSHVNISYADPSDSRYVSVSGAAAIVRDRAKVKELWNPIHKAWFPNGPDDPSLTLLRVSVQKAEYWDAPSSKVLQLIGFAKAALTGHRYQPGEHEKLDLQGNASLH
jgi:general stress protein 26